MIDLKKLIDLLPYYFKENDTYKDAQGKGILERFLEICGSYLEDQVVANIEGLLDNLNVESCPEHFLSYFWEWFGCIPFAEGEFIDPDKWAQYYNGYDDKVTYSQKKKYWTFSDDNNPIPLTLDQKRRILKYAISLIKCRGSKIFFETMFRLYGIQLNSITDGVESLGDEVNIEIPEMDDSENWFDSLLHFDEKKGCMQCIPVYFNITYTGNNITGFKTAITNFINKYIPFNAYPIITIVNGSGSDISGNKYYIRVTNLQTGESQTSDGTLTSTWAWNVYNNFQLFFKVEVWSDQDPTGEHSTWIYRRGNESVSEEFPNGSTKVIQEIGVNGLNYNFYNAQAVEEGHPEVTIAVSLTTSIPVIKGYTLRVEVWDTKENKLLYTNPTQSFSTLNKEIRVYAFEYENINTPNTGKTQANIVVSPYLQPKSRGDYWVISPTLDGQYKISLSGDPTIYRLINIVSEVIRYKVICQDSSGKDIEDYKIPAGSNEQASFRVIIKPEDESITDYKDLVEHSYIQCLTNGNNYQVSELSDGEMGINFVTRFTGKYIFRSLLNTGDNLNDTDLQDSVNVTKLAETVMALVLSPSESRTLELYGTKDNNSARTFRFNIELLYSSGMINYLFNSDPYQNGNVLIEVYDSIYSTSLSPDRFNWWGSDIDQPKTSLVHMGEDSRKGYFDITVPYKEKSDGTPYTGVIGIRYQLPLNAGTSGGRTTDPARIIYVNYTNSDISEIVPWVAIVPSIPFDKNWQLDWSTCYPQKEDGPKQTTATYQKQKDTDRCRFSLEVSGYATEQSYKRYDVNNPDNILDSGTVDDVTESLSWGDPGIYVFEDLKVTITIKDFVPDIKVSCNPTTALLTSAYGQVTTKVSLNIDPDKSSYGHKVRVLKDGVDTGEKINLALGDANYVATSKGVYTFRSIDAEDEGLTGSALTATDGTFTVKDSNDILGKIVCDPANGSIDDNNPTASTVVILYDSDGNELRDSAFLIRFPDGTTAMSGTTFTTDTPGTFTFTAANNSAIKATFIVADNTFKPQFGGVWVDPSSEEVDKYPYTGTITIKFTAWDVYSEGGSPFETPYNELIGTQLLVSYNSGGSSWTPITYAASTGERFNLFSDGGNNYHIEITGLTLNSDTQIRLRPALNPNYNNGRDTYSITKGAAVPGSITLDAFYNKSGNYIYYPGPAGIITGTVIQSDGTTLDFNGWYRDWLDKTDFYLDGQKMTKNLVDSKDLNPMEWSTASSSSTIGLVIYVTEASHTLYATIDLGGGNVVRSNTISINTHDRDTAWDDITYLARSTSDSGPWNVNSLSVTIPADQDYSDEYYLTGIFDGSNFAGSHDDEVNECTYNIQSSNNATLQYYLGGFSDLSQSNSLRGINRVRFGLTNGASSGYIILQIQSYINTGKYVDTLRIDITKAASKSKIKGAEITFNVQNDLSLSTTLNYNLYLTNFNLEITHSGGKSTIGYNSLDNWELPTRAMSPSSPSCVFRVDFLDSNHTGTLEADSFTNSYISFDESSQPHVEWDYLAGSYDGSNQGSLEFEVNGSTIYTLGGLNLSGKSDIYLTNPANIKFPIDNTNYSSLDGIIKLVIIIHIKN